MNGGINELLNSTDLKGFLAVVLRSDKGMVIEQEFIVCESSSGSLGEGEYFASVYIILFNFIS